jgi:hypothetical protein
MILTKSPHYINVSLNYATTFSVTLKLYIWEGEKANEPVTPQYTLTKERPDITVGHLDIEIADLIHDYITNKPSLQSVSGKYPTPSGNGVWVKYTIDFNDDTETITSLETIDFAVAGYGYFLEGINPQLPISRVLTSSTIQKVDDSFYLPYYADGTISQLEVSDGTTTNTYAIANETDSVNKLGFLYIDINDYTGDFITVTDSVNEWTFEVVTECRYTPEKILFLNKYGAYEVFTFFKAKKESLKVSSEDFNNAYVSDGSYDVTRHQKQKYNIQSSEKFTLNTDYIAEEENERIKELLQSDSVYLIGSSLIPVVVDTSSLEVKTRINDRLINYSLDFEYAYNKINNI